MMVGVNVVLMVLLVWTFTSVCVGSDGITINCEDVTAHVGDEITFTCTVSNLNKGCCMKMYNFKETAAAADDPQICKEEFRSDRCKQESRFSCPYTANKAMTSKFKFLLQTNCGIKTTEFSVNITDITMNCEDVTAHVGDKITLTCTVTNPHQKCCMILYKFINTAAADDDPTICKEEFRSDPCKQESRFSCPYTANKAMTTKFKFFLQTNCGQTRTLFTANIAEAVKGDTDYTAGKPTEEPTVQTDKTAIAIIIPVLSGFIIVIVALILWMRRKPSRSQTDYNMAACENNISEHSDRETMSM